MEKARVLFVSQEIYPFVKENELSKISRLLPENAEKMEKKLEFLCLDMVALMKKI